MTKQKILIADDEAQIREILRIYFEKEDFQVIEAEDGARHFRPYSWKRCHED